MKKLFFILVIFISVIFADNGLNCFTVIAGKECTLDGSVLIGHNEDDTGDQIVNMYKVPAQRHSPEESITLVNGGQCRQVDQTHAYVWLEMPGMEFADSYLNEHGVVIVSNNCRSREDEPELTEGGIGYWLRRIMAERAKSAREAVKIGGALVEKFGYSASGRSYCIADPNEAWVMSVVNGKQWVAQRVPDDRVMAIPNYYTIKEVDLSDSENFLGSDNLIDYATERGWYQPAEKKSFNFRQVYGREKTINHPGNINRHWMAVNLLSDKSFERNDKLPFSFYPSNKLQLTDIFGLLRNHYEGTDLESFSRSKTPHENDNRPICTLSTQYAFVAKLDANKPKALQSVMWYAPIQPCLHPFVPVYINLTDFPASFAYGDYKKALSLHFDDNYYEQQDNIQGHSFLNFVEFSKWINQAYYERSHSLVQQNTQFELELIKKHKTFEEELLEIYRSDPKKAIRKMTQYSHENLKTLVSLQFD